MLRHIHDVLNKDVGSIMFPDVELRLTLFRAAS